MSSKNTFIVLILSFVCHVGLIAQVNFDPICYDTASYPLNNATVYPNNDMQTFTICPEGSDTASITFTYFDLETSVGPGANGAGCWDFVEIFDDGVSMGTFCSEADGDGGSPSNAASDLSVFNTFTASDTGHCLTVVFDSDGSQQETGFAFVVNCPSNDTCGGARDYVTHFGPIGGAGSCPGNMDTLDMSGYTNAGQSFDGGPTCDLSSDAVAWYTWTATHTGLDFNSGADFPGLDVLEGSCGSFTSRGCLNNISGLISGLTIGTTYHLVIWDDFIPGASEVTWCLEAIDLPVNVNDSCANAIPMACGDIVIDSTDYATKDDAPAPCGSGTDATFGVWYTFVGQGDTMIVSTDNAGTDFDTELQLFSGSCGSLVCVDGADDNGPDFGKEVIEFVPVNGETYFVYVDGHANNRGTFELTLDCVILNDTCGGAHDYATVFGPIGTAGSCPDNMDTLVMTGYTDAGRFLDGGPTCDGNGDAAAWYTWTATNTGVFFSSGAGEPGLEVLEGSCGSFTSIGCLNNVSGYITGMTIGTTYHLVIWDDGIPGASEVTWCLESFNCSNEVTTTADDGSGSLRTAISCASDGDTITFSPSINGDSIKLLSRISVNKSLTFIGNGVESTIIDGSLYTNDRLLSTSSSDTTVFIDMTFQHGGSANDPSFGGAIDVNGYCKFLSCDFQNNRANSGGALDIFSANADIMNCQFFNNSANTQDGGAMIIEGNSVVSIVNSLFYENSADEEGGAIDFRSGQLAIVNSTFTDNTALSSGGAIQSSSTLNLHNSILSGNLAMIGSDVRIDGGTQDFQHNIISDTVGIASFPGLIVGYPAFVDTANDDYQLQDMSIGLDAGLDGLIPIDSCDVDGDGNTTEQIDIDLAGNERVSGASVDIGCFERPVCELLVTTTADGGPGSLRDAISCAMDGDTIRFDPGINGDSIKLVNNYILIDKQLTILGNGIGQTIVDGSLTDDILFVPGGSTCDVIFQDMTLQHGGGPTLTFPGGCMEVVNSAVVKMRGCHIYNNETNSAGGAILVSDSAKYIAVNCIFEANYAASFAGIAFAQNASTLSFEQCLMIDNEAPQVSGIIALGAGDSLNLVNCTMTQNTSTIAACFVQNGAFAKLQNNIIHSNDDQPALLVGGSPLGTFVAANNLVDSAGSITVGSNGNIIGDPAFVDTMAGNFNIGSNSAAIDAGDDTFVPIDVCDLDADGDLTEMLPLDQGGNARIRRCNVDIGAYEFGAATFCPAVNDLCTGAIAIGCDSVVFGDLDEATIEGRPPITVQCISSVNGLWYSFVGTGDSVSIQVMGTSPGIQVFTGGCDSLSCFGGAVAPQFGFVSVLGEDYLIYIDGTNSFGASLSCFTSCPPTLTVAGTPDAGTYFAAMTLNSDATIESPKNVIYQSGNEILLDLNFEIELGAEFEAIIGPCP